MIHLMLFNAIGTLKMNKYTSEKLWPLTLTGMANMDVWLTEWLVNWLTDWYVVGWSWGINKLGNAMTDII